MRLSELLFAKSNTISVIIFSDELLRLLDSNISLMTLDFEQWSKITASIY